jgi:diphthamide biosynthesis methyltransferase
MLYFIGLGLADERDITVKGLEIVRNASRVYLEAYTAILLVEKDKLVSLQTSILFHFFGRDLLDKWFECLRQLVGSFLWPICDTRRPRDGRVKQRRYSG